MEDEVRNGFKTLMDRTDGLATEVKVLTAAVREMSVENAGYGRYDWRPLVRFIESDPEILDRYMNFGFPKEQMEVITKLGPVMGRIATDGLVLDQPPLHVIHGAKFGAREWRHEQQRREAEKAQQQAAEKNKQNPMKAGPLGRDGSFDIASEQTADERIAAYVKAHETKRKPKGGKKNGKAT